MEITARRNSYAVIFALSLPTAVTLVYFVWSEGLDPALRQSIYVAAKLIQFAFPMYWVCFIQRHRPRWDQLALRDAGLGIGFGLLVFVAGLGIYHGWLQSTDFFRAGIHPIQEKIGALGLNAPWKFVALGVFYSLCHSFLEEYYWRWFVFDQLRRLMPLVGAILVSSIGFMAHHVLVVAAFFGPTSPLTWLLSLAVAVGGIFWAWLYHRSSSLLGPWLGHLLVDAAIFTIGYDIAKPILSS